MRVKRAAGRSKTNKKHCKLFYNLFLPGGQGRFRFLPLGPLATPVTPLKRSLREGYGTVRCVCTAPQKAPPFAGELSVSDSEQTEGELLATLGCFKLFSYQKAPQVGEPISQLFFRRSRFYSSSIFFANITLIMFIMPSTIMQTPITVVAAAALFMGLNSITMPAASIMNANTITSI